MSEASAAQPVRLRAFLANAPSGSSKALLAISAAESLTDWLALCLIRQASKGGKLDPTAFVAAIHVSGFVVERNSEWHLSTAERRHLIERLRLERGLYISCHSELASIASRYDQVAREAEVPYYLGLPAGVAYHRTALDEHSYPLYAATYGGTVGERWLAARLAGEQLALGVIPTGAIEPTFLVGMNQYREGDRSAALQTLRPIAFSEETRIEVAISAHVYARSLRRRDPRGSIALLSRSLGILEALGDQFGQAQVLHTLGQLLWHEDPRSAERLLRRSIDLGRSLNRLLHVSEVLHTLGQALWSVRPTEAETLLRESLAIDQQLDNRTGVAQVQHTLGQKLRSTKPEEATELLRASLLAERRLGRKLGQAQVLHTLAQHIVGVNRPEALELLRESLTIGESIGNVRHQAIVCLTLGKLLLSESPDEGRALVERSLALNRSVGDRQGEQLVLQEMRRLGIHPTAG